MPNIELPTNAEMSRADRLTIDGGKPRVSKGDVW
jgi:hypothetical protein